MPIDMTKRKTYIGDVFVALLDRGWAIQETVDFCNRLTTIDAVEVTRCRDCKHNVANWNHDELDATDYSDITCDYFMTDGMHPDDFCSYGERRDNDEN